MFIPWQLLLGVGIILVGYGNAFLLLCFIHEFKFNTRLGYIIGLILSGSLTIIGFLLMCLPLL